MLFLSQIKKDFQQNTWKRGLVLYRTNRVSQVKLRQNWVSSEVAEESASKASILLDRGAIRSSSCSCTAHGAYEKHCRHVAALASWILAKGSLLRAGVSDASSKPAPKPIVPDVPQVPAIPVAFVRGLYEGKILKAVTVEPAFRFTHPDDDAQKSISRVYSFQRILRKESNLWRTTDVLDLAVETDQVPIVLHLQAQKVSYAGSSMLEQLARILTHSEIDRIEFHENLQVKFDPEPLKLAKLYVGAKEKQGRSIQFEFKNSRMSILSDQLEQLQAVGKLSSNYCLTDGILYRFEKSLQKISQFANRAGTKESKASGYRYLEDDEEYPLHPLSVYRLSLELGVDDFQVDPDWKDFFEWKKTFEQDQHPALPDVDYGFQLRDYQKNGVEWVWSLYYRGLSALLADDMGLGKTHQILAVLSSFYRTEYRPKLPTLVIAPTSVVSAWIQKLEKYPTGLNWCVFHGKDRSLTDKEYDLVLTTYGILQREPSLREREWHCVILDEAQAIKNAITISSRASRVLKSKFRVAMTGTPIENHATDLWSIMEFLLPGYLGSLPRFKRLYGSMRDAASEDQREALKRLISPFLLRRTKSQVLKELPEKTEEVVACEMTQSQKRRYKKYLESSEAAKAREDLESGNAVNYANILSILTRLKQVCDHPDLPKFSGERVRSLTEMDPWESGKWATFEELVQEALGSGLKIVVFTQYLGMMDLITLWLKDKKIGYVELRGDTADRMGRIEKFANDAETHVFVCSLLAGSLGIDLTAGSVCIHFDRWWNPARENQATDRLHRLGQTRGVQVFKLQVPNSIEERIANIIQSKSELSDALIEQSALGLKSFSRTDLLDLLRPDQFD